jgi:sialate O-acetylesterase
VQAGEDGRWTAKVGPLRASFHETMQISAGEESLTLRDVQVGDVFLAAGQSNMEFHMRYDADLEEERLRCTDDRLRFFDYPEVSYPGQIDEADYGKNFGFWRKANPKQIEWFSAVGCYFAKEIRKRYDVPVGILGCNWGGTPACAWMSRENILTGGGKAWIDEYEEGLKTLDPAAYEEQFRQTPAARKTDPFEDPFSDMLMKGMGFPEIFETLTGQKPDPAMLPQILAAASSPVVGPKTETRPSGLYESMLKEVAPYTLKSFLYYQGESDGDRHPELYKTLFPALIHGFRELWG